MTPCGIMLRSDWLWPPVCGQAETDLAMRSPRIRTQTCCIHAWYGLCGLLLAASGCDSSGRQSVGRGSNGGLPPGLLLAMGDVSGLDATGIDETQDDLAEISVTDANDPDAWPPDFESGNVDITPGDIAPPCEAGCFLEPCLVHSQCHSGVCTEHLSDRVCTHACQECPSDWLCLSAGMEPGGEPVCLSNNPILCRPCLSDDDCVWEWGAATACVGYQGGGSFCATPCQSAVDCPDGYQCMVAETVSGQSAKHCVSKTGDCPCSPVSIALGLATTCEVPNVHGTCPGVAMCAAGGLTKCYGPQAEPESCNGKDDNCNGMFDEGVCGSSGCLANNDSTISIASFNIKTFGLTKMGKPAVVESLVSIVSQFDLVAIQEIRGPEDEVLELFIAELNAEGGTYDFVSSPKIGSGVYKEQYAFIFDTAQISYVDQSAFLLPDPQDQFAREPFAALFVTSNCFDFVAVNLHTAPQEATAELTALEERIEIVYEAFPAESDFIILGDLNADCSYYDEGTASGPMKGAEYLWLINNMQDTTVSGTNCTYDRIIILESSIFDFAGDAGVYDFETQLGLSKSEALAVSDHYPVRADFFRHKDQD